MTQGVLPFKYEESKKSRSLTSFSGLLPYVELLYRMNFFNLVKSHVQVHGGDQGWLDSQIILSLILLNLSGGDCVEDIKRLESDLGLCKAIKYLEKRLLCVNGYKSLNRRFRKGRSRCFASANTIRHYMESFHNQKAEAQRLAGEAYIPASNDHLEGLSSVNWGFVDFLQLNNGEETATLEGDATLVGSEKSEALYCYKHYRGYQPLNIFWNEQRLVVYSEFRDGNVPAGHQMKRVVFDVLDRLPEGVKIVRFRADGASYQYELMDSFEEGEHERFGRIEFGISCDISEGFKRSVSEVSESDWQPIYRTLDNGTKIKSNQEWAEVAFVGRLESPDYRYIAIRERVEYQQSLPGIETQPTLPFPNYETAGVRYKLSGLVTNMNWEGESLIHWSRKRCGISEQVHSVMKSDLCGGKLPSGKFGANAFWWQVMILALNLHEIFKQLALPLEWHNRRLKSLRFWFINVAGRVEKCSRHFKVILDKGKEAFQMFIDCRQRIARLIPLPGG